MKIVPSLNVKSPEELKAKISALVGEVNFFHLDIAKTDFTDYETWAEPIELEKIQENLKLEVHLMTKVDPFSIRQWCKEKVRRVIFHLSGASNPAAVIKMIKKQRKEPWICLAPAEGLSLIDQFAPVIKGVLLLGVTPGPSGQKMTGTIDEAIGKIEFLKGKFPKLKIAFDGGVNFDNLTRFKELPLGHLVVGAAIYEKGNPRENFLKLALILQSG